MWTYRPQLDGLRTVAVYLVVLFHAGLSWFEGGFIGVDLFFVLSGFLVSSVILTEMDEQGYLDLGGFYARRVRRLLPAAVVVVVATCLTFAVVSTVVRRVPFIGDAQASLLYYANWHFLGQADDYFSQGQAESPFLHFWSLAIEEQFYVLFPLLLAFLYRRAQRQRRIGRTLPVMVVALVVLMLASLAAQLYWAQVSASHAYYGTDARLYQLLAGAVVAVVLRSRPRVLGSTAAAWSLSLGIVALGVLGSGLVSTTPSWRGVASCLASVATIAGLMRLPRHPVSRVLSRPIPVYLGKISYGTYLWHWPVMVALGEIFTFGPFATAAFGTVLSTGLAALAFQVIEMPVRRSPFMREIKWRTCTLGVLCSVLVATQLVGPVLSQDRRPALAAQTPAGGGASSELRDQLFGKLEQVKVPDDIDWKKAFEDRGGARNCAADAVADCFAVRTPGAPTVLLVGDSYANMLFPMFVELAKEKGFSLASQVFRGCPWVEGVEEVGQSAAERAECTKARVGWYDTALPQLKPDLVIAIQRPRDTDASWGERLQARDGRRLPLSELTFTTMADTVTKLDKAAPAVLLLQSVIALGANQGAAQPLDCLARAEFVGDCAHVWDGARPPSDGFMQAEAASHPGVFTANLNGVVCPTSPVCLTYLDGQIVWRDGIHLMTSFAMAKRAEIWKLIQASGATKALEK